MTLTGANVVVAVRTRVEIPEAGWAFYCRQGEHDRCAMVCACPHHDEPHGVAWEMVPLAERLQLIDGGEQ